jgi:uncharacterized membrane protein
MKKLIEFIKITAVGGLVVILPIAIITIVIGDTFKKLIEVTKPLTEHMPFAPLVNSIIAVLTVAFLIIATFFFAGLLLNTFWGKVFKNWFETKIFERIPMYSTFKGLTQRFVGIESSDFPVVEVDLYGSENRVLGIVVEQIPDGRLMVFIPISPLVTVGQLNIVPDNCVKKLDASLPDMIKCISQMGLEAGKLFKKDMGVASQLNTSNNV